MAYKISYTGGYPKKKRIFHHGEFSNKEKAKQWCRNHSLQYTGLKIHNTETGDEEEYGKTK